MSGAVRLAWLELAALVAVLFVAGRALALEVPKLEGRVNDYAELLPPDAERRISQSLEAHEKATGQQFVLLTIKSLEGDPIEDFSERTTKSWQLGRKGRDDGLLFLVAKEDREARVEVGYGLEGTITDALSSRVIRNVAAPAFRQGDYAAGIEGALNVLMRNAASGGTEPVEQAPARGPNKFPLLLVIAFFLLPFLIPLLLVARGGGGRGRGLGGWYGGYGGWGGGGWGGGHRGGGFGGGFGGSSGGGFSGGGGSFGGGGASGSW